ncbi:hypothetical protein J6590_007007 [Homalodisca vitripennis]|nr:hypothetical protein J6590_007007 [Homalodisca vitripennis]
MDRGLVPCNSRIVFPNTGCSRVGVHTRRGTQADVAQILSLEGATDYTRGAIFPNELDVGLGQKRGESVCLDARGVFVRTPGSRHGHLIHPFRHLAAIAFLWPSAISSVRDLSPTFSDCTRNVFYVLLHPVFSSMTNIRRLHARFQVCFRDIKQTDRQKEMIYFILLTDRLSVSVYFNLTFCPSLR